MITLMFLILDISYRVFIPFVIKKEAKNSYLTDEEAEQKIYFFTNFIFPIVTNILEILLTPLIVWDYIMPLIIHIAKSILAVNTTVAVIIILILTALCFIISLIIIIFKILSIVKIVRREMENKNQD